MPSLALSIGADSGVFQWMSASGPSGNRQGRQEEAEHGGGAIVRELAADSQCTTKQLIRALEFVHWSTHGVSAYDGG